MDTTKVKKERLDVILTNRGIFESREKAKIAIMEGLVFVNNQKEDKAGALVKEDSLIEYRGNELKYVSRGGYKLEKGIEYFNIDLNNKICMDVGSSTGGFTDCMLQNGAKKVYAIDCGTNQLAYKLRNDDRVISLEKTNARYITNETVNNDYIDFSSIDVSFISLDKILPAVYQLLNENAEVIALIKPQFEAGRELVSGGVIKDKKIHIQVIKNVINFTKDIGYSLINITYSPIKGPKGNIEYLLYLKKDNLNINNITNEIIEKIVNDSHENL